MAPADRDREVLDTEYVALGGHVATLWRLIAKPGSGTSALSADADLTHPAIREIALAATKLEECQHWIMAALRQ